ncbi:hypothetical protein EV360DRAFT_87788 [Lentinula raphanica]|nr:hypothetical protein EV360DRAFT_87788 [Lentinula raphanica]
MAIGWEGILLFDMILFAMTLWKAYQNRGSTPYIGNKRVSTFSLLVRDGAVYFLIIASLNLANIISFHIPGPPVWYQTWIDYDVDENAAQTVK